MSAAEYATYADLKARLDEIVDATADEDRPIDEVLSLYEEAVDLGLAASDLIEQDIAARRNEETAASESESEPTSSESGDAESAAETTPAATDGGVA